MSGRRKLNRNAWFKGEVNGHQVHVGSGVPEEGTLIQWYTIIDGEKVWHDDMWQAHGYVDEQTKEGA